MSGSNHNLKCFFLTPALTKKNEQKNGLYITDIRAAQLTSVSSSRENVTPNQAHWRRRDGLQTHQTETAGSRGLLQTLHRHFTTTSSDTPANSRPAVPAFYERVDVKLFLRLEKLFLTPNCLFQISDFE